MKALIKKITKYWKWGTPQVSIVGSPTKTSTSIFSNFGTSNYLVALKALDLSKKPWEIGLKVTTGTDYTHFNDICGIRGSKAFMSIAIGISGAKKFCVSIGDGSTTSAWTASLVSSITIKPSTVYWFRLKFTGTQYIFEYSLDGKTYTKDKVLTAAYSLPVGDFLLGVYETNSANWFSGSIDLTNCYIKKEGKFIWIGMTTRESNILDFDFTTQSTACQSYRKEGMNHVFFDGKPIQLKIQARTPFSVTATSGWADPANAFDGDLNTVASCGTATDYIEVTYTKPVTLKGINATLWWQAKVSRFSDLRLYSVNGSTETLICTTTGAGEHAMTLTSASFNPISGTKFRIRLTEANSAGDPPTTTYRCRIRRLHLIEGDQ